MSLLYIGSLVLQAVLIIHCIKTGRNQIWIWVLALLSYAGILAYLVAELLPELLGSRATRRTVKGVKQALDPQADLRRFESEARVGGNVASQQRYADELLRQGRASDAIGVYQAALKGLYEHDPDLMLGLARAQFATGAAGDARTTLDALVRHNPQFRSAEGHLLYARALEAEGDARRALDEYQALAGYYPGAEAAVRYAELLQSQQRREEARKVLNDLMDHAKVAPPHYRRNQEDWLKRATQLIAGL